MARTKSINDSVVTKTMTTTTTTATAMMMIAITTAIMLMMVMMMDDGGGDNYDNDVEMGMARQEKYEEEGKEKKTTKVETIRRKR